MSVLLRIGLRSFRLLVLYECLLIENRIYRSENGSYPNTYHRCMSRAAHLSSWPPQNHVLKQPVGDGQTSQRVTNHRPVPGICPAAMVMIALSSFMRQPITSTSYGCKSHHRIDHHSNIIKFRPQKSLCPVVSRCFHDLL